MTGGYRASSWAPLLLRIPAIVNALSTGEGREALTYSEKVAQIVTSVEKPLAREADPLVYR